MRRNQNVGLLIAELIVGAIAFLTLDDKALALKTALLVLGLGCAFFVLVGYAKRKAQA